MMICKESEFWSRPVLVRWREGTPVLTCNTHDDNQSNDNGGRSTRLDRPRGAQGRCSKLHCRRRPPAYIDQFADHLDEKVRRQVVRLGNHHERDVLTAAGAVNVKSSSGQRQTH